MGARISPEDNRVSLLLKPQPFADKIPSIPILAPTAVDVPEVGGKKFPVNLMTQSEPAVKGRPEGESMDVVVAEASNRAVPMAVGYKVGGAKMGSVIPMKRKLVKTMMYHSIKDFVISFFRKPPSAGIGPGVIFEVCLPLFYYIEQEQSIALFFDTATKHDIH
ncbi:unnamed protein product [Citrullus colocynthis]|uniref:Reverse transcriptase domain-containing protein n=1 Tax=Citrullus colocynthis TaxID=252529 RepID=A0ABP0XZH4_9ROSI